MDLKAIRAHQLCKNHFYPAASVIYTAEMDEYMYDELSMAMG
jgi:hypothetical protein